MANSHDEVVMGQLPLTSEELRHLTPREPTAEVPEELQAQTPEDGPRHREFRFIDRSVAQSDEDAPSTVPGYRPPWMNASLAPRRARLPEPPKVMHRGDPLEPLVVWGADDRKIYNDTDYPWGCVCKITNAAGKAGSGVLIGPRQVLTASHVVDWSTDIAEKIEVHLTGTAASATAFDTIVYAYTHISGNPGISQVDEDYAVLVTDDRLGDRFGFMGTRTYDSAWDGDNVWRTVGYPGDIAGGLQPTFQRDKNMDEDEWDYGSGRAMTTSADIMPGQSGSPMFGYWDDEVPDVVAVVSAHGSVWASGTENWCAGGTDLGRLVRQARDENP